MISARLLPNVYVTGLGPVSAIGSGKGRFYKALRTGRSGVARATSFDTRGLGSDLAAEIPDFDLAETMDRGRILARRLPRPTQLALAAARLALTDAGLNVSEKDPERTGLCLGTSVAHTRSMEDVARHTFDGTSFPPDLAFRAFHHSSACTLSSLLDTRGPLQTISTGCNSGLDAIGQAARWIQVGDADIVVAVGTDVESVRAIALSLDSAGSLSTKYNATPERAARPFGRERDGIVLGEGAAALVLESEDSLRARGATPYAKLAAHEVRSAGSAGAQRGYRRRDSELLARTIRGALHRAGWDVGDIDLVNANGSASVVYDELEARALFQVFGDALPDLPIHSIKSMLGQTGAGSSALQAVTACLSLRHNTVPPTPNSEDLDPACGSLRLSTSLESRHLERVLVNATGMGGIYFSCAAFEASDKSETSTR